MANLDPTGLEAEFLAGIESDSGPRCQGTDANDRGGRAQPTASGSDGLKGFILGVGATVAVAAMAVALLYPSYLWRSVHSDDLSTVGHRADEVVFQHLDSDGDGLPDEWNEGQGESDSIAGLTLDADDDNDGVSDELDLFPLDPSENMDTDGDGIGNNTDSDDDNDGVDDTADAFPLNALEGLDTDGDGVGNNADPDDDGDGIRDSFDAYPLDAENIPTNQLDIDGNGQVDALTDTLLITRFVFGFTGDVLINGALGEGATRTSSEEIEAYLEALIPEL